MKARNANAGSAKARLGGSGTTAAATGTVKSMNNIGRSAKSEFSDVSKSTPLVPVARNAQPKFCAPADQDATVLVISIVTLLPPPLMMDTGEAPALTPAVTPPPNESQVTVVSKPKSAVSS